MALVKCTECGRDVSSRAAACPNCGAPPDLPESDAGVARPPLTARKAKPELVESDDISAPGSWLRTSALMLAALIPVWAFGYITRIDDSPGGFIIATLLNPGVWAAFILGRLGDRRADTHARCGECGHPVLPTATVCSKCGRDIRRLLITGYAGAQGWVLLIVAATVVACLFVATSA